MNDYGTKGKVNKQNRRSGRLLVSITKNWQLYLMLLPFLIYYILFYFRPMKGIMMAFQDFKPFLGIEGSKWVGLDNFATFINGPYFGRVISNTLIINILNLLFGFPIPIILAFLFNEIRNSKARTAFQTISYLPYFISTVVVAGIIVNFLSPSSGIVNSIIRQLGGEPIYFLVKPEWFRPIYIIQGIWTGAGFGSIMYYSALCSIDTSLYEAVAIDGGSRLKQLWHVALPGIRPTIAVMLILQIGNLLNVGYEMIILLYEPATYKTADVISTYMYRVGMENGNYSMSTAVGLINGVISLILVITANKISKKVSEVSII